MYTCFLHIKLHENQVLSKLFCYHSWTIFVILPVHKFIDIALKYDNENKTNILNIIDVWVIWAYYDDCNMYDRTV